MSNDLIVAQPSNDKSSRQLSFIPDEPDFSQSPFERIKHIENGIEFWYAHELMKALEYSQWQKFKPVIEKAKESCTNGGYDINNHFIFEDEMVDIGSGARRRVSGYKLSRAACDYIAMNGDVSKPIIAEAQAYFITQTRRQELADQARAKQAAVKKQQDIVAYQNKGKSRVVAENRVESKDTQRLLNTTMADTHEEHNPDYASASYIQNTGLFNKTKREIIAYLGLLPKDEDKYRDYLGEYALKAYQEVHLLSNARMRSLNRSLTTGEQDEIIARAVMIFGSAMRAAAHMMGQDFISGAPLNAEGKPMLARNVRLLK